MALIRTAPCILLGLLLSWSAGCLPDRAAAEQARQMEARLDSLEMMVDTAPARALDQLKILLNETTKGNTPSAEIRTWELIATASKYTMDPTSSLVAADEAAVLADRYKIPEQIAKQYINRVITHSFHSGDIAEPALQEDMQDWLKKALDYISKIENINSTSRNKLEALYYLATSLMYQINTGEESRGKDADEIKQNLDKALERARLSGDNEIVFVVLGNQLYLTDYYAALQDTIINEMVALVGLEPDEQQQQQFLNLYVFGDSPEAEMESIIRQAHEAERFDIMLNGISMLFELKKINNENDEAERYITLLLADSIVNRYPGIKMRIHNLAKKFYEDMYKNARPSDTTRYFALVQQHKGDYYELVVQQSNNRDQTYKKFIYDINLDRGKLAEERARTSQILAGTAILALVAILLALLIYQQGRIKQQRSTRVLIDTIQQGLDEVRDKQIQAEEDTRTAIGRELHDSVKANIAAAKMAAEAIYNSLAATQDQTQQSRYVLLLRALNSAQEEARNLSHRLLHTQVADLKHDIENWCQMLRESAGFKTVTCTVTGLEAGQPEAATRLHILRIIQSLTQNIIYHAYASAVTLQLVRDRDVLRLVVEDNGRGFDPQDARVQSKGGMKIIEARVSEMGGALTIDSKEGQGTTVTVEVPFRGIENPTSSL
ncbi:MAG: ATP-binding protein [Bacteroidia bacterium]|nr:ATP-binding protein [Bacteroidia bacterium]